MLIINGREETARARKAEDVEKKRIVEKKTKTKEEDRKVAAPETAAYEPTNKAVRPRGRRKKVT